MSSSLEISIWEERWNSDVRSARALAAFKLKDSEIKRLREENDALREKIFDTSSSRDSRLERRLSDAREQVAALQNQLDASRRNLEVAVDERNDAVTSTRAIKEQLKYAEGRISDLIYQNTELEQNLKDQKYKPRVKPSSTDMTIKSLKDELVEAQQRAEEAINKLAGVKTQRENLATQLRETREALQKEKAQSTIASETLRRRQEDLLTEQDSVEDLRLEISEQKALITQLQTLHADAQLLLKNQQVQHRQQVIHFKASQKKLLLFCKKLEQKHKNSTGKDKNLKEKIKKLNSTLNEKTNLMLEIEEARARQDEEIISLRFQIQSLLDEAQLAVSKDDVLQTKRQASKEFRDKQLQEVMAMHHKQLTVATERKGAMEAELKNIIEQNGNLVESLDQMRAREQELKSKVNSKIVQSREAEKKLTNLEIKAAHFENQWIIAKDKLDLMEAELNRSEKSCERLKQNLKEVRVKLEGKDLNIEELNGKIEGLKLNIVRMRYRKRVDDDVSDVDSVDDQKPSSRSAQLEMKMLKNSQSKMAREITELKLKKTDAETEIRDQRKSHLVVIGERNDFKKARDQLSDECRKLRKENSIQTQRIEAMAVRVQKLTSENAELRNLKDLPEKLRTVQARVKNTTAENSHLRNKLEQIENTVDSDHRRSRSTKEKIDRLQKDLEQKKLLIEDQRSRIKNLEKERQEHRKKIDSLEEKIDEQSSTLSQNKRTSQNLRRHAQDIKMEKESFSLELHNLRKKVEELEIQEAKMKIDMNRKEREYQAKRSQIEAANEELVISNEKALQLLRERLNEITAAKSELVQTVNILAKDLFTRVGREKAARQSSSHTGVQSKVCEILDISASEFGNLMTDKGDQSWPQSIRDVLDAGAPFADTIANSFKYQLDELTRACAPVSGR